MSGTPDNGQVVETTTRRRIVSSDKLSQPFDFWTYLENLTPEAAQRHIIYAYRTDPQVNGQNVQVGKFVYPWTDIPWNDREEAEAAIAQKWGGRAFLLHVKDRSQRMGMGKIVTNMPPKVVTPVVPESNPYAQGPQVQPANGYGYGDTARVAETAIHTMANQEKQAVDLGIAMMSQAANVVKNFSERPPSQQDDLTKQIMAVLIQRALAPPPDPMELLTKLLALQAQVNPAARTDSRYDKLMDLALDKIMNPAPSGPATSTSAELVRQFPNIASNVVEGLREYRLAMEAQARAVAASHAQLPPPPTGVASAPTLPPPQVPAPNGGENMDGMNFLAGKIIEIFNEPVSAEAAAEETLDFIERLDRAAVPQLVAMGEQGLNNLFITHPILQKASQTNLPRVQEYIRAFLKFAGENTGPSEQKPN
jgi:hypothetical protein